MSTIMQASNTLRLALSKTPSLSFGAWQMLPGTHLSRTIARSGYDWVCIDTEHGNISDNEMHESVQAIASCGVSPIIRIASNEGWMVKRALDAGAHGIIVPLIRSVEETRRVVAEAKFPPQGRRGFGSPFSMGSFDVKGGGLNGVQYLKQANESLLTAVQIETREALENVDEIAQVPGLDILFIGPYDLGNAIGHPVLGAFDPELTQAIAKIKTAADNAGKKTGIYSPNGDVARIFAEQGFHMISVINDMTAIPVYMAESLSRAKGTFGQAGAEKVRGAAYGGGGGEQGK